MRNAEIMTITLTRIEVCDLLIACTLTGNGKQNKWTDLHDKIVKQLDEWDTEYDKTHID